MGIQFLPKESVRNSMLKTLISCLVFLLSLQGTKAQNQEYWREGFTTGPGLCDLTTVNPTTLVPVAVTTAYFKGASSGIWWGKNLYNTTGTGCPTGNPHVRARNLGPGFTDSAELVTPVVSFGIQEFHFTRARANRAYTIWVTNDTSAITSNWNLVTYLPPTQNVTCVDTSIVVASAAAKRLKITMSPGMDYDIDSIWLTSFSRIAAPFTPGNLVVNRVGSGLTALSNQSARLTLMEFSPSGSLVDSIIVPFNGPSKLMSQGSSSNDGSITNSNNGQHVTIYGYNADEGVATVSGVANTPRIVRNYNIDKSFTDIASGVLTGNARCATTNGTNAWVVGSSGGVIAGLGLNGTGLKDTISTTITNNRFVSVQHGQLFLAAASGVTRAIWRVGNGTPNTGPVTATPYIPLHPSASPNQFCFNADTNICYVSDDGTLSSVYGIRKYTRSGSVWTCVDSVNTGGNCRSLIVDFNQTNPIIYAIVTTNKLVKVIDVGSNLNTQTVTLLNTAPTNTAYRGISFAPGTGNVVALSVSTTAATSITSNSAVLGGTINNAGSSAIVQRGIVYSTTANPTFSHTKVSMGTGIGSFSQTVSGLNASTQYYFRAFAINSTDTAYGSVLTFTTSSASNEIPQNITGLQLWLDASDVNNNGNNPANNTNITTWKDRSGAGNDAIVLSGKNPGVLNTNQINGKSTVRFTRTSQFIGSVYNVPNIDIRAQNMPKVTIFTVYKQGAQTTPAADQAIWGCDNGGWDRFFFSTFPSGMSTPNDGGVAQGTYANRVVGAGTIGKTQLLTAAYDHLVPGGSAVYFNGTTIATFGDSTNINNAQTTLRIGFDGDDNCYNGDIAEMLVYNRKLTQCEIQTINKYLSNKYGVEFTSVSIDTSGPTTFNAGDSVVLSSSITASSYQWLRNGLVLSGATSRNLTVKTSGSYQVIASNACSDTSSVKVVTVNTTGVPKTITGLQLWLDASDINNNGSNPTNGSTVNTWKDKSGAGNDAVVLGGQNPGVLTTNQINGKSVVNFVRTGNTTGSVYNVPNVDIRPVSMPKMTIFAVYKQGTLLSNQAVWGCDNGGWDRFFFSTFPSGMSTPNDGGVAQGNYANRVVGAGTVGKTQLLTAAYDHLVPAGSAVYFNGTSIATFGDSTHVSNAQSTLRIGFDGDDNPFNGDIAEMIVYNKKLSYCEILSINKYLGDKYGVSFSTVSVDTSGPTNFRNGDSVILSSSINATSYQWLKDGIAISGANAKNLLVKQSGNYRVIVTNSCIDTSSVKTVTVLPTPIVSTSLVTNITTSSADLGGIVSDTGSTAVTERGVVYATTINPSISNNKIIIGSGIGTFSQNLTGLSPNTTYYVRAYAINSAGISYGANEVFTTLNSTPPSVITASITAIGIRQAVMGGEVTNAGSSAVSERGVVYGTTPNPSTSNNKIVMGNGTGSYSQNITGLNSNTTYHVRAYAINNAGITYGADSVFTTLPDISPTVITATISSVGTKSAILGGEVIDSGTVSVTERGVVYANNANPTVADNKVVIGAGMGSYSQNVTGLIANTSYHVRAYAINSAGISYGADSTFTTLPERAPSVSTASIIAIGTSSATMGGIVTDSGTVGITERGVVYATTVNPTTTDNKIIIGTGIGSYSQNVSGLQANTVYHVRAYAINSIGTSYGADSTFKTLTAITLPTVLTGSASTISNTSATLAGNVTGDGGANVTERGIVLSTSVNPTTSNTKIAIGNGIGSYAQSVTALNPNTTYHYRAYAINSNGTAYGADSIFSTLSNPEFNKDVKNAFSPDGDGINDSWVIDHPELLEGHEITIYNIFGQVVFNQIGYNTPWDGKKDGNPVPSGEYYYHIKGNTVNIKGALLIKNQQ